MELFSKMVRDSNEHVDSNRLPETSLWVSQRRTQRRKPAGILRRFSMTLAALIVICSQPLAAQDSKQEAKEKADPPITQSYRVRAVKSDGEVVIADQKISYQVETGKLVQTDDAGKEKAEVFFVAYTRPSDNGSPRPLSFAFNGGPGSSSVWLHLGMLGPKRIVLPDDATPLRPPYQLSDNPMSLLDVTDLVFIDPVSTGYSRPAEDQEKSQFHGYQEDVQSVAQFIHDWTTHYKRWNSPKFLIGESYGGIRAAGLAGHLQSRYNYELNGIVVISGAINFQTLRFGDNNDLPYICFLPTYAATAWYHGQLSDELQAMPVAKVVNRAERFSLGEYASVLLQGSQASEKSVNRVVQEISRLTGLDETFIRRSKLRITMSSFGKQLLREDAKTIGRFDSRYVGIDRDQAGSRTEYDPSGSAIFGPFTATMNHYLRESLNYEQPRVYEILTGNVQPWNYETFTGRYVDASESLRSAMTSNPYLKLYVACGYYDLATPHFAMQYTVNHLGLDDSLKKNVTLSHFEGGHMMYIYEPAMESLRDQLVKWYADADGM
jgi:carboxypeptidase C (cathepsin A)